MIRAAKPAVGETRPYAPERREEPFCFLRGIAAKGRACILGWHAGAYVAVSDGVVLARRGNRVAGWAAVQEYIDTGKVQAVRS